MTLSSHPPVFCSIVPNLTCCNIKAREDQGGSGAFCRHSSHAHARALTCSAPEVAVNLPIFPDPPKANEISSLCSGRLADFWEDGRVGGLNPRKSRICNRTHPHARKKFSGAECLIFKMIIKRNQVRAPNQIPNQIAENDMVGIGRRGGERPAHSM